MIQKYISIQDIRKRKCPLSRLRCLAPDCALWRGGMVMHQFTPGRGHAQDKAGLCQLAKGVK